MFASVFRVENARIRYVATCASRTFPGSLITASTVSSCYSRGNFLQIVADTAWVVAVKTTVTHRMSPDSSSDETTAAFENQVSRVERRSGKWALVRREP